MNHIISSYKKLTHAVCKGKTDVAQKILSDPEGLLHLSSYSNDLELFKWELIKGQDGLMDFLFEREQHKFNYNKGISFDLVYLLSLACYWNNLDLVKKIHAHKPSIVTVPSEDNYQVLRWTMQAGHMEILQYLVSHLSRCSLEGLHKAIKEGLKHDKPDMVKYLFDHVKDVEKCEEERLLEYCYHYLFKRNGPMKEYFHSRLSEQTKSLHPLLNQYCADKKISQILKACLRGQQDKGKVLSEIYVHACTFNQLDIVKEIVTNPRLRQHCNFHYQANTALSNACLNGHIEIVDFLVFSPDVNIYFYSLDEVNLNNLFNSEVSSKALIALLKKLKMHQRTKDLFETIAYLQKRQYIRQLVKVGRHREALALIKSYQPWSRLMKNAVLWAIEDNPSSIPHYLKFITDEEISLELFNSKYSTRWRLVGQSYDNSFVQACHDDKIGLVKEFLNNPRTRDIFTPLLSIGIEQACIEDHFMMVDFLLEYAKSNHLALNVQSAYEVAFTFNSTLCLKVLLEHFPDACFDQEECFNIACNKGAVAIARYMFYSQKNKMNLSATSVNPLWLDELYLHEKEMMRFILLELRVEVTPSMVEKSLQYEDLAEILKERKLMDLDEQLPVQTTACKKHKL